LLLHFVAGINTTVQGNHHDCCCHIC
jgi:hypothetical protein